MLNLLQSLQRLNTCSPLFVLSIKIFVLPNESAKLGALRTLVPFVPRVPRALARYVPPVLRALVLHVPRLLRALVSYVPRAVRALVPHVPHALRPLVPYVPCAHVLLRFTCLVLHVPSSLRGLMPCTLWAIFPYVPYCFIPCVLHVLISSFLLLSFHASRSHFSVHLLLHFFWEI